MAPLMCMSCKKCCSQERIRNVLYVRCKCTLRPAENEHTDLAETIRRRLEIEQVVFGNFDTLQFLALA